MLGLKDNKKLFDWRDERRLLYIPKVGAATQPNQALKILYDSDDFRESIANKKSISVIPGKSNRLELIEYDEHIYKERHVVECFFSKIKYFRRVFSRYDKSIRSYRSFVLLAVVDVWLR